MPQPFSSSLVASVAASPSPASPHNPPSTNTGFSTFRSLRSLLPFGPGKISHTDASPTASAAPTPPRGSFSGFSSMRKSLARDRERKTSLTNLLPVISIDRSSAPDLSLSARRAASCSHIEQHTSTEFGENKNGSQAAPVLRSISPGPPLSADLSTIIEADSSGVSKTDPPLSPSPTEGSLDLNPNQIAKQVYDAINEKEWLAAENALVIDAEDTDDAEDDEENELTEVLPLVQSTLPDNTSINIENVPVDPSIVALLSPNSLPQPKNSPAQPSVDAGGTTPSSIPRLRPMHDPKTPRSSSSDTTFKASTPTASSRRMPSYSHSPLSSSSLSEIQPTRITVTATTPEKSVLPRLFGAQHHHHRSLTTLTRSHSAHSVTTPSTPSSLSNRLQVHHPASSSSETHLRTPSPIRTVNTPHTPQPHSPHTPQTPRTPQLVSTQGSSTSSTSTAPNTPSSPHSSSRNPSHSRIPTVSAGSSISRQSSESSASVIAHRFRAYHHHETSAASVGHGRASLDSTRPPRLQPAAPVAEHHVLATSTPFRRASEDGFSDLGTARRRREQEKEEILPDSPSGDGRSASPSPNKIVGVRTPFRSRKRSMSVQESFRAAQNLIAGRRAQRGELVHHMMNGASRSHSSLSGRALTTGSRIHTREDDEDDPSTPGPPQRPPLHDWLGPRSVKALRAAGLLDDREREREDHQLVLVGRNSRERSGSVATSVMSGGSSGKTTGGSSAGGRNSQQHAFSALGYGRAPSRMAFSDAGGPSSSRRASGSGTFFSHLMHSPTLTTSTSTGSREGKERDIHTSRSPSTAPTSVSTPSMVYLRDQRDRDEIQEMKDRHATETGALLSALSDSQRTTKILREENHELRERLERLGDLEVVNEDLKLQMRSLKREVGELKLKLQVLGASRAPGPSSSRSGLSTPIPDVVLPPPSEVPDPETPKHHRRCPSDTSSIFPVLPSNMTMLMHEEDHMHEQLSLNGDEQGDQSSTVAARNGSRPVSFRKLAGTPPDGNMGRNGSMTINNPSISPTTANFSMITGSPGSLFLRPEHEVHLGDLDTFSLDMGRVDDSDGLIGTGQSVGLDDW